MNVKFGYPQYMPSPYSVYVSHFTDDTFTFLKNSKPFARYHKQEKEFEVTPEIYEKLKTIEPSIIEENSLQDRYTPPPFIYHSDYEFQYQDDAIKFVHDRDSALVNFSQGLGKSRTSLCILEDKGCQRILIITGVANLQEEWLKDAKKHLAKNGQVFADYFNLRIVGGDPGSPVAKRIDYLNTQHTDESKFADLIGIESLRNVFVVQALNALHYDAIVVDEVQAAKGMKAEQTEGLHELIRYDNQVRLALSGTPALNDPLEYYSVLRFLGVLYYHSDKDQCSRSAFIKYYGEWGVDYWGHFVCTGYKHLDQLKELLLPVLMTVPKSILNLPKKNRYIIKQPVQNPRYQELQELYSKGSKKVKKSGYATIQALASQLQVMTSTDEPKIQFVIDHTKAKDRPLVFSQYTTVLDAVKKRLEDEGFTVYYYHGKLTSKERLAVLEQWKSGKGDVLLLSIAAARYGLNLQETQTAIFLEPPTSPAILEQAEDRLHRIGQQKEVNSFILISGKSDEDAWQTIERKCKALSF